jgi:hypothetical protein
MTIVEKKPKESHPFASPAKSEAHGAPSKLRINKR